MDPLSIAASAIALIQAAGSVTTSLYGFVNAIRTADSRISSLCDELSQLISVLEAVQKTLKERRPYQLALIEDSLWHQCEVAVADCQLTLCELAALVNKIKETTHHRRRIWTRQARLVIELNIHGGDLTCFRDKVTKSNCALQTMLQAITVSLTLRNNTSQEKILFELKRLKSTIDVALRKSLGPRQGLSTPQQSDRVARNLQSLAEEASRFHLAASSAASSIASVCNSGSSSNQPWLSNLPTSLAGDIPEHRRRLVEAFVQDDHHQFQSLLPADRQALPRPTEPREMASQPNSPRPAPSITPSRAVLPQPVRTSLAIGENDEEDDDAEVERAYLVGIEEFVRDQFQAADYSRAIDFLNNVLKKTSPSLADARTYQYHAQLAVCHLLQGEVEQAEQIAMELSKLKGMRGSNRVIHNLLHALSLVHLSQGSITRAMSLCQKALGGKKKRISVELVSVDEDYAETLALYVRICLGAGDDARAEVFRRQLHNYCGSSYWCLEDPSKFIIQRSKLLHEIFQAESFASLGSQRSICGSDVAVAARESADATPSTHQLLGDAIGSRFPFMTGTHLGITSSRKGKEVAIDLPALPTTTIASLPVSNRGVSQMLNMGKAQRHPDHNIDRTRSIQPCSGTSCCSSSDLQTHSKLDPEISTGIPRRNSRAQFRGMEPDGSMYIDEMGSGINAQRSTINNLADPAILEFSATRAWHRPSAFDPLTIKADASLPFASGVPLVEYGGLTDEEPAQPGVLARNSVFKQDLGRRAELLSPGRDFKCNTGDDSGYETNAEKTGAQYIPTSFYRQNMHDELGVTMGTAAEVMTIITPENTFDRELAHELPAPQHTPLKNNVLQMRDTLDEQKTLSSDMVHFIQRKGHNQGSSPAGLTGSKSSYGIQSQGMYGT